ncbi:MAG TPA: PAS domain S-box protein, partial [Candidatus Obscuribacterales bacterium]
MNNTLIAVGMAIATSSVVTLPLVTSLVNRRINSENANSQPLRQNEERFRSLVQNSSDIITILDRNGIIIYESPSVEPILGYESEELLGKNKFDYVHPEDLLSVQAAFDKVIQNHGNVVSIENRFRHKDGSWVYLECVANNLLDDASVKGIVINSRDITERKQAELALQKQTEREHLMGAIAQRIRQSLNLEEILQ